MRVRLHGLDEHEVQEDEGGLLSEARCARMRDPARAVSRVGEETRQWEVPSGWSPDAEERGRPEPHVSVKPVAASPAPMEPFPSCMQAPWCAHTDSFLSRQMRVRGVVIRIAW